MNAHIHIPRRAIVDARLAFSGQTDAVTFIHPGRNFYRQGLMVFDSSRAAACNTRTRDKFSAAMAFGARLLNGEKPLLHSYLSMAVASRTHDRRSAGFRAAAMAGSARIHGGNADLGFRSACGMFQRNFQVIA